MKLLSILLFAVSVQVLAHENIEDYTCQTPENSGRISTDMEREMFQAELAVYEKCMFDYIREQQKQADVHEQAAQSALDAWNDYLSKRLR